MLVLTRKAKQQIQIGPNVTITILQIKGQAVRVGIEAPKDVTVLRSELAKHLLDSEFNPTVAAAVEKDQRESEIKANAADEQPCGRTKNSAKVSSRCRAPRVDVAPLTSPYQSTGSASLLRPRRRRMMMK
jgi:carbon storage regulator